MSKFLKGNYHVETTHSESDVKQDNDFTKVFESKALEKLGGSIAFVVKKDQLVWDGDDDVQ
jgi:hypothetical protein